MSGSIRGLQQRATVASAEHGKGCFFFEITHGRTMPSYKFQIHNFGSSLLLRSTSTTNLSKPSLV